MVIITSEAGAVRIHGAYKKVAAFTFGKNRSTAAEDGTVVEFDKLNFLPTDDEVNAVKNGDIKLKKLIKQAVKSLHNPTMDDESVGLGMTLLLSTLSADRKAKYGPAVLVFVEDEADPVRNKIMKKFITALFEEFGIEPLTKSKEIKRIFKGKRSKVIAKVRAFNNSSKAQSKVKGSEATALRKLNLIYYGLELTETGIANMEDASVISREDAELWTKNLLKFITAENLKLVNSDKVAKSLSKKDKAVVTAYKQLAEILASKPDSAISLPKAKYGQKKKKGKPTGPKTNVKKFRKFYLKKKNRWLLVLVYTHITAALLGAFPGSKDYERFVQPNLEAVGQGMGKEYITLVKSWMKNQTTTAAK